MATVLKLRRGTTSTHSTFTGENAELTLDTDKNVPVVHDGTTAGGFPLVKEGDPTDLSNSTTDELSEGSSNKYYTDALARAAISTAGDLSYNQSTGEISFTERTDSDIRNLFSATGDISYDSATGTFSFSEGAGYDSTDFDTDFGNKSTDDLSEGTTNLYYNDSYVDARLSGGTGVTYSAGSISIGQDVGTGADVQFNSVDAGTIDCGTL